ncbi:MAG: amidohydrolase family protein, partial [Myxococcota bacterium]
EDDAKKKDATWDVETAPGPRKTVTIDTDEGTWLSLTLSPDGKTIVFDLLGDLYSLPIDGGEATSLTSGMAWDMQPSFSPDGKWIAFTSDRDGADNIWVMPAGGGEPRQITKEDFRLLNSPTWTPDGQFIAARKHFTARRSLGSGEIWLYHIGGDTKGVRMTEKPNDQKDVGEPAFSPDGRYLYFSQDTTPGQYFEYNKDPHSGIYDILRMDREDGHIDTFAGGPGGAVRPTPSPDGKSLAFVRREGLKTVLAVKDLASGGERIIYRDLDRDMQETWAIHGVYPTMAWTPDNAQVVFWAGGKFHRVDVASGNVTNIPFRVKDTREVVEALRTKIDVHPKTFHTKMLRDVQVSPDGKRVIFQTLGRLYVRSLPDGKPKELTSDKDVHEFFGSFSRDGKQVVFVSWTDDGLASVRTVRASGGRSRAVTQEPGHYFDPTFSPDGKTVVFRKGGGGWLTSPLWSGDKGLYAVPARGGTPTLITHGGASPHFGKDDDRVFFTGFGKGGKRELRSIELDGSDVRTHVGSQKGTRMRVSPDGKWLAFKEGFNAYITPFPASGRAFDVGPNSKSLPTQQVSRDTGDYLHWSGDSMRLYWSTGPELFARDLTDAFSFIDGAPEELPKPPEKGTDIGFDVDSYVPDTTFAFTGARIVTMKGDEVIEDGVLVVEGDRITAVGKKGSVTIPSGAKTVDVSGKTIIPGLVDVHAHGSQGESGITPQQNWLHYATLSFGVTTVHDPSNDTAEIFSAAELSRAGEIVAPRIFSTGTILYGADAPFTAKVNSLDDARSHLRRLKSQGAISVKSYNQPRRNQRQQVLAAARELDMMVVPEGGSTLQHNLNMIVDGHTGIEHAVPVANGYDDLEQLWVGTEVGYTPTMGVGYGGLGGELYWYAHTNVFEHPKMKAFVPPHAYEPRSRRRPIASKGDWNHFRIARLCATLQDAGVKVNLGAHGQREGLAAHWELWMFAQGGMTNLEALRAVTIDSAHYVGMDADIGSLEVGKLADLAIIDGNPVANIRDSDKVTHTMVGGRLFDAETMNEVGGREVKAEPFYWQGTTGSTRPTTTFTQHRH